MRAIDLHKPFISSRSDANALRNSDFPTAILAREFLAHYYGERNHQDMDNQIIEPGNKAGQTIGAIQCHGRSKISRNQTAYSTFRISNRLLYPSVHGRLPSAGGLGWAYDDMLARNWWFRDMIIHVAGSRPQA